MAGVKILVGCPVHQVKAYSIRPYLEALDRISYPKFDLLLMDNSPTVRFSNCIEDLIDEFGNYNWACLHIPNLPQGEDGEEIRLGRSREAIRKVAMSYNYWWSLECDVIVPPSLLSTMLEFAKFTWVTHNYPARHDKNQEQFGMGCLLIATNCLKNYRFDEGTGLTRGDVGLREYLLKYPGIDLHGLCSVEHINGD